MWTPKTVCRRLVDRLIAPVAQDLPARSAPKAENIDLLLRPRPEVVTRQTGQDIFLVHLSCGTVFRLNHTGQRVWDLLATAGSAKAIAERLAAEYRISAELVGADVQALLKELLCHSLVEPASELEACTSLSSCP